MSADRFKRSASVYDSGSWNKYSYTRGDPVNGNDSTGMLVCQVGSGEYAETTNCEVISIETRTGEKDSDEPASNFPQCNPGDSPLVEKKLNFITANYNAALSEANSVISGAGGSNISAGQLATVFLQWSMWESGYNSPLWAQSVAQNNYFGLQQPSPGSAACATDNPNIPPNTKNACFPSSTTWAQELGIALSIVPSTTGASYLSALEGQLPTGTAAQDLQAIAKNGWNGSSSYGSRITSGINIQSLINCALTNNLMNP